MLAVGDERISRYAELLVDTCLGVQPGWQVVVYGTPEGRPLVEEIVRTIGRRDAYALLRVTFGGNAGGPRQWVADAPLERLREAPSLELHTLLNADALIVVDAPENTRDGMAVGVDRQQALQEALVSVTERVTRNEVPWVGCQFPTPALAQDAGMSTEEFAEFLYAACLLDWDAERERMQRYADLFDAAAEVRIVGDDTDLTLGIEGRSMLVDAGGANIPGGEFFCSPVEDSATGDDLRSPSFRRSTRVASSRASGFASRAAAWSTRRRRRTRSSCSRRSTPTTAHDVWASSASAATRASPGT